MSCSSLLPSHRQQQPSVKRCASSFPPVGAQPAYTRVLLCLRISLATAGGLLWSSGAYYGRQAQHLSTSIYEQMHPGGLHCEASRLAAEKHSPVGVGSGCQAKPEASSSDSFSALCVQDGGVCSAVQSRGNQVQKKWDCSHMDCIFTKTRSAL